MLHDDHLHLRAHTVPPKPHELGPVIEECRRRGIIPGVREHPPLPMDFRIGPYSDYDYGMNEKEVYRFVKMFAEHKIAVGIESDFIAGYESETASIIDEMISLATGEGVAITGVHGSVHLLPGTVKDVGYQRIKNDIVMWDLDEDVFKAHLKDRGAKRLIDDYFSAILELIGTRLFDVLSHIDLIRKFDRKNSSGESIYFADVEAQYVKLSRKAIEKLAESGMAIEINTAGFCNLIGRPYITEEVLKYGVECGVPVSLGSDAHVIERIGSGFDVAVRMLQNAGADNAVTFENREPIKYVPEIPSTMNCCDRGCRE